MIGLILGIICFSAAVLFAVGVFVIKVIYSIARSAYGMSVTKGADFQDNSKHSRRARESRKIAAETHALAELALTRASWSDEYIREHGEEQRKKDEKFIKRTYRAVKWKAAGLLLPQGLAQTFATRLFTLGDNTEEYTDSEGNTYMQVIDPNWKNGDDEAEGNGKLTHPYRSSAKIAIITAIGFHALEPGTGILECAIAGISLGITVPVILRCFEIMTTIRLRFLAEKTHRAVVLSQYPCVEGRNISENEKEFLAYVCEMHRRYGGDPVWKPNDDYGLLMPYEFCAFLGDKGAIGKADNWIDKKLAARNDAGNLAAVLFREVGKQTPSEDEAYGKAAGDIDYDAQMEQKKQREDINYAREIVKKECELLADCLFDTEMMSERYNRLNDMHYGKQISDEDWALVDKWYAYIMPIMKKAKVSLARRLRPDTGRDTSVSTDESVFGHTMHG